MSGWAWTLPLASSTPPPTVSRSAHYEDLEFSTSAGCYSKLGRQKTEGLDLTVRFHLLNAHCKSTKTVVFLLFVQV